MSSTVIEEDDEILPAGLDDPIDPGDTESDPSSEEQADYGDYAIVALQDEQNPSAWEFKVTSERGRLRTELFFLWEIEGESYTGRNLTHTFAQPGTHLVSVTGSDRKGTVLFVLTLEVTTPVFNQPPIANCGPDERVEEGTLVVLSGAGSYDPDEDELTYLWAQGDGPAVELLENNGVTTSFIAPEVEGDSTLTITLTVGDGEYTSQDSVRVYVVNLVETAGVGPTADAGPDQTVLEADTVTLDGSQSSSEDGGSLSFEWFQFSGPTVALSNTNAAVTAFQAPAVADGTTATLEFELVVTEGDLSASDEVVISVEPDPSGDGGSGGGGGGGGDPPAGCTSDADCDDGDACNGSETCQAGACVSGTPLTCDDGDACNGVETCQAGACVAGTPPTCDDGLYCNGLETCDAGLGCQPGTPVDCNDGVSCTVDTCNEATDSCDNIADDSLCDNGSFCDGAETCDASLGCQTGSPVDCDDGVGCTNDACNEATDACDHITNDASCDDGLYCNGAETCDAVLGCQAGTAVNCDDGVACTNDSCNEGSDSCDNASDDSLCANGLFCDGAETCDAALGCQPGSDPCPAKTCNEVTDTCEDIICAVDGDCDDGLWCNGAEMCVSNVCQPGTPQDCNDGVACTDDSCNEGTDSCDHNANDGLCDNGLFCDGVEACDPVLNCQTGGDPCPGASCDEASDSCVQPAMAVSTASLDFGLTESALDFEVWNSGGGTLTYTAEPEAGVVWLSVEPSTGSSTGEHDTLTASIDRTSLTEGSHESVINLVVNGVVVVAITVTVVEPADPGSVDPLPIAAGAAWRYAKGTSEPPAGWTSIAFDDSAWLTGPSGIGYGDGDDATVLADMANGYLSVYARRPFRVDDPTAVTSLTLTVDYDDGFVAYLNGVEVARGNVTGNPPAFDQAATANHDASADTGAPNPPESFDVSTMIGQLVAGTNVLAIQGHNRSIDSSDFSLIPELQATFVQPCTGDAQCDDGLFCNGTETCVSGTCRAGADPCSGDPCDEAADVCVPPTLSVNPTSLSFSKSSPSKTFEVWNSGGGSLTYDISITYTDGAGWLTVSPPSGSSSGEHDTITAEVDWSGLPDEPYQAQITVTATWGSPPTALPLTTIPVTTTVGPSAAPMWTASRTDGVAPLAVFFDAVDPDGDRGCGVVQPDEIGGHRDYASFHYEWQFDDDRVLQDDNPDNDSLAYWSTDGTSKNTATGYVAAHVFEVPGNYTVKLRVTKVDGTTVDYEEERSITVHDPDVFFAPPNGVTYYVCVDPDRNSQPGAPDHRDCDDANDGRSPRNAFLTTDKAESMVGENVRILFERGGTFTTSTDFYISTAGPASIGAYSNPDYPDVRKPILKTVSSSHGIRFSGNGLVSDWRIADIHIQGPGGADSIDGVRPNGLVSDLLLLRVTSTGWRFGVNFGVQSEALLAQKVVMAECDLYGNHGKAFWMGAQRCGVLGCRAMKLDTDTAQGRFWHLFKTAMSHNVFEGSYSDRNGNTWRIHGNSALRPCQYIVVSSNDFKGQDGGVWPCEIGPQSSRDYANEPILDVIVERNVFRGNSNAQVGLIISASHVTVRNNVFIASGTWPVEYFAVRVWRRSTAPAPVGVRVCNNTLYRSDAATAITFCDVYPQASDTTVMNNLVSAPFTNSIDFLRGGGSGLIYDPQHNRIAEQSVFENQDSGQFNTPADFALNASSSPIDAGVFLPFVFRDYIEMRRPALLSYDLGAFEYAATAR